MGLSCSIAKSHAQIIDLCFGVVAVNIKCLQDCLLCLCNGVIQSVYIIAIMTGGIGPGNKPKKEEEYIDWDQLTAPTGKPVGF